MSITTTNPATGRTVRTFEPYTAARVNESIDRAVAAYREHRKTSFAERAVHMRAAAAILDAECRELGRLMTLEMGKPYKAAMAEAEKCATACRYYADNAERFLADDPVEMESGKAWVAFQPIGVVLATDRPAPSLPVRVTAATRRSAMIPSTASEPMSRV